MGICDPDYYGELHPNLVFLQAQNAPLGPQTGSGAVPELPQLRDTPRHSGAGPETPCFVSRLPPNASKVLAILLGFWKLRNFLRPINASSASMKEATAKRHLPVGIGLRLVLCPVPTPGFPKLRTWPWNLCWAEAFVNMAVDKCQ